MSRREIRRMLLGPERRSPFSDKHVKWVGAAVCGLIVVGAIGWVFHEPEPEALHVAETLQKVEMTKALDDALDFEVVEPPLAESLDEEEAATYPPDIKLPPAADVAAPRLPEVVDQALPAPAQLKPQTAALPPLPMVRSSSWQQNAMAFTPKPGIPMIAVVIDDMGVDKRRSAKMLEVPGPLNLSWMTYADNLAENAAKTKAAGHEIWLHMPMEPMSAKDAGQNALKVSLTAEEIRHRVEWGLDRLPGLVGVNNHMGSRFTAYEPGMDIVMQSMKARGLVFLDSVTTAQSVVSSTASKHKVPHLIRNVFIDNEINVGKILGQLRKGEAIAKRDGFAILIGHPHDATIQALHQWRGEIVDRNVQLVPLSAILKHKIQN